MVDAPQPMSAAEFVKLDHAGFRTWLKANNLGDFESTLPASSDLKPSDLLSNLFETGALNLKAILDDEVGAGVYIKLSTVARIQDGVASAANLKRAAGATSTSRSGSGSAKACLPRRALWGPMVAAANLLDVKAPEQLLRDGVQSDHVARVVIPRRPCRAARQRRRDVGLEVAYCIVTSHLRSYRGAPPLETHRGGRGFPAAAGHPSAAALSARTAARATRSTSSGSRPPANRRAGPAAHCCPRDAARCIPTEPP